ncbi:MAG: hypothetical protein GTO18_20345 [Anaerolineales bacterium]|nr:hypothetical protein [Anaerolineales bacterium]
MKCKVDQEVINFVIQQVDSNVSNETIIVDLHEQYGLNWQEAEKLVLDIEIPHRAKIDPEQIPILPRFGFGILIIAAIYLLAKSIFAMESSKIQKLDLIILFAAIATFVMFLVLFLLSILQNSIKETYRCPHCGYLANYKGNEDSIFLPRFQVSTYYTREKRTKTWHETFGSGIEPEWDTYAEFEITDYCRNCAQVRKEHRDVRRVDKSRRQRDRNIYDGP